MKNLIIIFIKRVTCKLCVPMSGMSVNSKGSLEGIQFNMCHHGSENLMIKDRIINEDEKMSSCDDKSSNNVTSLNSSRAFSNPYVPKMCPRHRVPSICSSETGGPGSSLNGNQLRLRRRRNRSYVSNTSDVASSVDLNEYKSAKAYSYSRRRKYDSYNEGSIADSDSTKRLSYSKSRKSFKSFDRLSLENKNENMELNNKIQMLLNSQESICKTTTQPESNKTSTTTTRVHFHLNHQSDDENVSKENNSQVASNEPINYVSDSNKIVNTNFVLFNESRNEQDSSYNSQETGPIVTEPDDDDEDEIKTSKLNKRRSNSDLSHLRSRKNLNSTSDMDDHDTNAIGDSIEWESYFDSLELNAIGRVNINI